LPVSYRILRAWITVQRSAFLLPSVFCQARSPSSVRRSRERTPGRHDSLEEERGRRDEALLRKSIKPGQLMRTARSSIHCRIESIDRVAKLHPIKCHEQLIRGKETMCESWEDSYRQFVRQISVNSVRRENRAREHLAALIQPFTTLMSIQRAITDAYIDDAFVHRMAYGTCKRPCSRDDLPKRNDPDLAGRKRRGECTITDCVGAAFDARIDHLGDEIRIAIPLGVTCSLDETMQFFETQHANLQPACLVAETGDCYLAPSLLKFFWHCDD
jgi:hypothetical protein